MHSLLKNKRKQNIHVNNFKRVSDPLKPNYRSSELLMEPKLRILLLFNDVYKEYLKSLGY